MAPVGRIGIATVLLVGLFAGQAISQRPKCRSNNGPRNDLQRSEWGAANMEFNRSVPTAYVYSSSQSTVSLANGEYTLAWRFVNDTADNGEMVEFTVSAPGSGWVGLGVAASATSFMQQADIVMARVLPDGSAQAEDMWAAGFFPPSPDSTLGCSSDVRLVSASRAGGRTSATFRRPLAASDPRCDRPLSRDGDTHFIFAWNPDTPDIKKYHGSAHRGAATIRLSSAGPPTITPTSTLGAVSASSSSRRTLRQHGTLMIIAFCLLLPLAMLMIKLKNSSLAAGRPRLEQGFFYAHILFNVTAVTVAAAGVGLNFSRLRQLNYRDVPISHGSFGVAIMTLFFAQALYPWFRPKATPLTFVRRVWELVHTGLGRAILVMGLVNVAIGIHLITTYFGGSASFFVPLAAVPVAALTLLGSSVDRANWQAAKLQSPASQAVGDDSGDNAAGLSGPSSKSKGGEADGSSA